MCVVVQNAKLCHCLLIVPVCHYKESKTFLFHVYCEFLRLLHAVLHPPDSGEVLSKQAAKYWL